MKKIRGIYRLLLFAWITASRVSAILIKGLFPQKDPNFAWPIVLNWRNRSAKALGIETEFQGNRPDYGVLYMPNHRSYIDVLHVMDKVPTCFVAKIEVKPWPLIGRGADLIRSIWVDRSSKDSRRETRHTVKVRLEEGISVTVFPEGTTYKAPELGELHRGIFQVAADGEVPVVPVGIEYENVDDAWVGKDTFIPHFIRTFGGRKKGKVLVRFGEPIRSTDGNELREKVAKWLEINLKEMQEELGICQPNIPQKS